MDSISFEIKLNKLNKIKSCPTGSFQPSVSRLSWGGHPLDVLIGCTYSCNC